MFYRGFSIACLFLTLASTSVRADIWKFASASEPPDFLLEASLLDPSEPVSREFVASTLLTDESALKLELIDASLPVDGRPWSQPEITARVDWFVGVHRRGDLLQRNGGELDGGTQVGFRGTLRVMETDSEGFEFGLSRFGGEQAGQLGPEGFGFPETVYRNSLWTAEINRVIRERVGAHQRTALFGVRALTTSEDWDGYWLYSATQSPLGNGQVVVSSSAFSHREQLDTRLLAAQFGWEKSYQTPRFDYLYGIRSAVGVGHFASFTERQTTSGGVEPFESSDFDVGTVAEYYVTASYRISERLSLSMGLYRLSVLFFDNEFEFASQENRFARQLIGANLSANCKF
ncbi:MAG: hypothetical protein AAFU85_04385 [Planctomycetota bacterium]